MSPLRKIAAPEAVQVLKQNTLTGVLFCYFPLRISRPGFRLETIILFEYFFGERVF